MTTWVLFGLGSVFFIATMTFAILFHILAGRVGSDMANGCLALIICGIGAALSMSCYYFAVI